MTSVLARGPTRTHRGHDVAYNPKLPERLQFISSTQMKQFRECQRKWFFTTQRKIDVSTTSAMALGSQVHEILEEYAKTGDLFNVFGLKDERGPVATIAFEALQYLPEWGTDWQPEVNLADPEQGPQLFLSGVPFVSYADLYVPARFDNEQLKLPLIVDYKTTSALHWAKNEEQLKADIQGVAYARWALEKSYKIDWGDIDSLADYKVGVKFPWLLTRGKAAPRSICADFIMSAADTTAPWPGFERDVLKMLDMAWAAEGGELRDRDVPGNYSACDSFGGCPHRAKCDRITRDGFQLVQLKTSKEIPVTKSLSDMLGVSSSLDALLGAEVGSSGTIGEAVRIPPIVITAPPGFDLYIDAVPLRGVSHTTLLEAYIGSLNAQIVKDYNETHERSISDVLEIEFGKWRGPLRALLASNPPQGAVLARSQGETSQVALEVLKPLARSVIQGVR